LAFTYTYEWASESGIGVVMSNTNADDKLIGFEYQFYYFVLILLKMGKHDKVGFEVKEDVHQESEDKLILYQLKHTIQTTSSGLPKNLTTSDKDLWKTLSLWIDIIKEESDKESFIQNTKFVFVSNKSDSDTNDFLFNYKNFKDTNDFQNLENFLNTYKNSANDTIKKYLINICDFELKELFFKSISFELNLDNVIEQIKEELQYGKSIKESRVDNVFHKLIGVLKEDFFKKVKDKESFEFSSEDFYLKTIAFFKEARSDRLPFQDLDSYSKDIDTKDMIFAKQLLDIGFDDEKMYEADYNRLLIETNLKQLYQDGEITKDDIERFETNTIETWKEYFEEKYLEDTNKNDTEAKKLFLNIMKLDLRLAGQKLEWKKASKGQFISISNIPKIGWKHNWESEYVNED
jgi:hypothetical protein